MRAGKLVRLFPEWTLPRGGVHAVFPPARFRPPKVRAFLEMLVVAERGRMRETAGCNGT
jgi:DNA-binding transcriptional LysR family regulator